MTVLLTKTRTVMQLKKFGGGPVWQLKKFGGGPVWGGTVFFESPYDPVAEETWMRDVSMLASEWEEMGKPNTITVTIELGDQLNEEGTD